MFPGFDSPGNGFETRRLSPGSAAHESDAALSITPNVSRLRQPRKRVPGDFELEPFDRTEEIVLIGRETRFGSEQTSTRPQKIRCRRRLDNRVEGSTTAWKLDNRVEAGRSPGAVE
jgi:hypothetical protein